MLLYSASATKPMKGKQTDDSSLLPTLQKEKVIRYVYRYTVQHTQPK